LQVKANSLAVKYVYVNELVPQAFQQTTLLPAETQTAAGAS
jgi:hypothetical protein